MWEVSSRVIAVAIAVSPSSTILAQAGVGAPDIARRHVDFTIEFDASRSFLLSGTFVSDSDQEFAVESAQVNIGEAQIALEVVPRAVYGGLALTQESIEAPVAAFDVYSLSDDLIVVIGDSTFGSKAGPFEPFFAALQPDDNAAGNWSSEVAVGLWSVAILFEFLMPHVELEPDVAAPAEEAAAEYTCNLDIEEGDIPHRLRGVLPNGKPVEYLLIETESGEIKVAVICIDEETGVVQLSMCLTQLPLVGTGTPGGITAAIAAVILRLTQDSIPTVP